MSLDFDYRKELLKFLKETHGNDTILVRARGGTRRKPIKNITERELTDITTLGELQLYLRSNPSVLEEFFSYKVDRNSRDSLTSAIKERRQLAKDLETKLYHDQGFVGSNVALLLSEIAGIVSIFIENFLEQLGNQDFFKNLDIAVKTSFIGQMHESTTNTLMEYLDEKRQEDFLEKIKEEDGVLKIAQDVFEKSFKRAANALRLTTTPDLEALVENIQEFYDSNASTFRRQNEQTYQTYIFQKENNERLLNQANDLLQKLKEKTESQK